jgi:curli biogenesis system outer membrane secretion channel CsgG
VKSINKRNDREMSTEKSFHLLRFGALSLALLLAGCATVDEAYFLDTKTKANVFVTVAAPQIKKIAVMPFKAPTELLGSSVADIFVTELLRAGRYDVLERSRMAQVLSESELALAGVSAAKATEIGAMMGADAVVLGTVDEYSRVKHGWHEDALIGMSARMIDCKSGQVVWSVDLVKHADDKHTTLAEHARTVAHEMVAALYRKWRGMR